MSEHFFNWLVDTMARTETLDLFFVASDLIDIPETFEQRNESAFFDSMAVQTAKEEKGKKRRVPIGKLVI
jgi:hypothetical protein